MIKQCLTSAAVLAMLTGVAMAQTTAIGTTTSTQSTTTTVVPPVDTYSVTKTQRNVDGLGTQIESSQTYKTGLNGSATRTETQVKRPDGSTESSYREQWSNAPGSVIAPAAPPAPVVAAPVVVPAPVVAVPTPVLPGASSVVTLNPDGSTTTTTRTTTIGR